MPTRVFAFWHVGTALSGDYGAHGAWDAVGSWFRMLWRLLFLSSTIAAAKAQTAAPLCTPKHCQAC